MDKIQEIIGLAQIGVNIQQELQDIGAAATKSTLGVQLETQRIQAATKATLEAQLETQRIQTATKVMELQTSKAGKQAGIAKATASKNAKVEVARRIARDLAKNGPITIDDVTEVMIQKGYEKAEPEVGDAPANWKGAIFRTLEWVCVHNELARLSRSHARPNKLWALKSWLDKNPMNGKRLDISRFDIEGIRRDFEKANPKLPKETCHWFVGTGRLADDVALDIRQAGNTYVEVPVTFIPHAVGALLQYVPPQVPVFQITVPAAPAPTTLVTAGQHSSNITRI